MPDIFHSLVGKDLAFVSVRSDNVNSFLVVREIVLQVRSGQHESQCIADQFCFCLRKVKVMNGTENVDAEVVFLCGWNDRRQSAAGDPALNFGVGVEPHEKKSYNQCLDVNHSRMAGRTQFK
jgi:hypothetical protein